MGPGGKIMGWNKVGLYRYPQRKTPWLVRWYGEINPATGKPKRYGKSFRTKQQAAEFCSEKMHEFRKGIKRDRPEDVTVDRLCDDFLKTWNPVARKATMVLYAATVHRLLKYFGKDCLIRTIGPKEADSFIAAQTHRRDKLDHKLSDWTRMQIVNHCKVVFGTALRWQWLLCNPFAHVHKPKPVTKKWHRLTVAEYAKLLETAPTLRWKCFYALAYTSGARFGELFNLTWADIDFERGRLHIENRDGSDRMPPFQIKDHEARFVQLPSHTINLLAQYQSVAPEGVPYVLLTKERYEHVLDKWCKYRKAGKEWQSRNMVNNVLRDFRVHAKRAEIGFNGKFTVHTFRKSCAQNWADCLPGNVVKFYMGHSKLDTTNQFYSIVDESHMERTKNVMDKMLEKAQIGNSLDTGQTLALNENEKSGAKKKAAAAASIVTPSHKSTSETQQKMEPVGIEPATSCMPCKRSPS